MFARALQLPAQKSFDGRLFASDYPVARCVLFYGGDRDYVVDRIRILPLASALPRLLDIIG